MLDAHTAVEASTFFFRNLVVGEAHLPPRFVDYISKVFSYSDEVPLPKHRELPSAIFFEILPIGNTVDSAVS